MMDLGNNKVVRVNYEWHLLVVIDLGNDVVAYVDSEENHPIELARGSSDIAVLHKDDLII